MKRNYFHFKHGGLMKYYLLLIIFFISENSISQTSWIRINQLGYLEASIKNAVLVSKENPVPEHFELYDASSEKKYGRVIKLKIRENMELLIQPSGWISLNSLMKENII